MNTAYQFSIHSDIFCGNKAQHKKTLFNYLSLSGNT